MAGHGARVMICVANIALDDREVRMIRLPVRSEIHDVVDREFVASIQQLRNENAPDIPGAARDEHLVETFHTILLLSGLGGYSPTPCLVSAKML